MVTHHISLSDWENLIQNSTLTPLKKYGDHEFYGHILENGLKIQVINFIDPPGTVVYKIV